MPKVAVVMAGCGFLDGTEIHESTLSLLYLAQGGATYDCYAPDENHVKIVNHANNEQTQETRNQLAEAARIARGAIQPITEADPAGYDGLVLPGGTGAFLNLGKGPGDVHPELKRLLVGFVDAGKPVAAICIAPLLVARALGDRGVTVTIGTDEGTASAVTAAGAKHVDCPVNQCVVDEDHKIVTTPAYMLGPGIADVSKGIQAAIEKFLEWCA